MPAIVNELQGSRDNEDLKVERAIELNGSKARRKTRTLNQSVKNKVITLVIDEDTVGIRVSTNMGMTLHSSISLFGFQIRKCCCYYIRALRHRQLKATN